MAEASMSRLWDTTPVSISKNRFQEEIFLQGAALHSFDLTSMFSMSLQLLCFCSEINFKNSH